MWGKVSEIEHVLSFTHISIYQNFVFFLFLASLLRSRGCQTTERDAQKPSSRGNMSPKSLSSYIFFLNCCHYDLPSCSRHKHTGHSPAHLLRACKAPTWPQNSGQVPSLLEGAQISRMLSGLVLICLRILEGPCLCFYQRTNHWNGGLFLQKTEKVYFRGYGCQWSVQYFNFYLYVLPLYQLH